MTLHLVFQSLFLILGLIIGINGSLSMLLSVFSVLGVWWLFSVIIEYKWFRPCSFSIKISTRKFNSSSRYFPEHKFFTLDTNPLKMSLINAGLTYECSFIWTFVIAFFRYILNSYFLTPVLIIVTSKKFSLRDWSSFFIVYCIALFFLFKIFRKLWDWCTVLNLEWLTRLLYYNGAEFVTRASCSVLSSKSCRKASEDYENIMQVTDTSKDAEYQKSKHHLRQKNSTTEKWTPETFTDSFE